MNGTEEIDCIRQTLRQAMPDDLPAAVEERMKSRLTAFRQRFDTESTTPRGRILQWIGGLTVRQRIAAFGGVGIVAILGLLLLWGGIATRPVSAMDKMAENIRKAKSYKAITSVRVLNAEEIDNPSHVRSFSNDWVTYWVEDGSYRKELIRSGGAVMAGSKFASVPPWKGPGPESTQILVAGKQLVDIDHRTKTFFRQPPCRDYPASAARPEDWGQLFGQADCELGVKDINGKRARGFQIQMKKIYPKDPQPGTAEIWIDTESNLPVHVCIKTEGAAEGHYAPVIVTVNLQWNLDLDPKLFDPTPPEGYKEVFPALPPETHRP